MSQKFTHNIEVLDVPQRYINHDEQRVTDVYATSNFVDDDNNVKRRTEAAVIATSGMAPWLAELSNKVIAHRPATKVMAITPEGVTYSKQISLDTMLSGIRVGFAKKRAAAKVTRALKPYRTQQAS